MVSFYLPWHGSSKYFLLLLKNVSLHRDVEIKHIVIIFMIFNWQSVLVYCVLTVKRVKSTQSLTKWFLKRSHGMFKIVNSTNFSSISWELEQFHVQSNYLQLHSKFMTEWNGFTEEEKTMSVRVTLLNGIRFELHTMPNDRIFENICIVSITQ